MAFARYRMVCLVLLRLLPFIWFCVLQCMYVTYTIPTSLFDLQIVDLLIQRQACSLTYIRVLGYLQKQITPVRKGTNMRAGKHGDHARKTGIGNR